jgi:hypothetical protein
MTLFKIYIIIAIVVGLLLLVDLAVSSSNKKLDRQDFYGSLILLALAFMPALQIYALLFVIDDLVGEIKQNVNRALEDLDISCVFEEWDEWDPEEEIYPITKEDIDYENYRSDEIEIKRTLIEEDGLSEIEAIGVMEHMKEDGVL